jgi:hypothetical protein
MSFDMFHFTFTFQMIPFGVGMSAPFFSRTISQVMISQATSAADAK